MSHIVPLTASTRFYGVTPEGEHTQKESLALLKEAGFDGVDFALEKLPYMFSDDEELKRYCFDVADYAASIGMEITFGHLPFYGALPIPKKDPGAPAVLHRDLLFAIKAAGYLGMKRAVIHPIGSYNDENTPENRERRRIENIEFIGRYVDLAEKGGFKLAIENMRSPKEAEEKHFYSAYAEDLVELCDALGQEICWDFGHAHTTGVDQQKSLELIGKRLTVTHINDNHGGEDEHLLPYFGTANWESAIAGLRAAGFSHSLNLECKMFRVPSVAHIDAGRYGVKILEYFTERIFSGGN